MRIHALVSNCICALVCVLSIFSTLVCVLGALTMSSRKMIKEILGAGKKKTGKVDTMHATGVGVTLGRLYICPSGHD